MRFVTICLDHESRGLSEVEMCAAAGGLAVRFLFKSVSGKKMYYTVTAPDEEAGKSLVNALIDIPEVQAAYLKPVDSLP